MVDLTSVFNRLRPFNALLIGDFLVDTYTIGHVRRISPEAPVQVLEVMKQESRPGGAGNVVLNLISLGASVFAMGRIGADCKGSELKEMLQKAGADVRAILTEEAFPTPVKNRMIAESQQLLRVDLEKTTPLRSEVENAALALLEEMIPKVQVVAISDYGKGFLSNRLISRAIALAKQVNVPCIVDPKGDDFTKYRGATLVKPNLKEAYAAAKMPTTESLDAVATQILNDAGIEKLLITRSEEGISLFERAGQRVDFPVRSKEVKDVTGAGDTVLAMISLGLANQIELSLAAQFANIAAGIAIEKLGCATIKLSEVAERLLEFDYKTKIFDETRAYALQQILKGKSYSLLVMDRLQLMTGRFFKMLREHAKDRELVLYIRDAHPVDEFIHLLASFQEIKGIILQKESLKKLCTMIQPYEVFFLDYDKVREAKELLAQLMNRESVPFG